MSRVASLTAAAIVAGLTGSVLADSGAGTAKPPRFMSEADLARAFGGKTIDGSYAGGLAFTETYTTDGRIEYREADRAMTGRWLVAAGAFCTLYDTSPTGGCFRVVQRGGNCFEFYFVARDDVQVERGGQVPSWTAQAWIKGQPATCTEEPIV